jgi:hypothetical protein
MDEATKADLIVRYLEELLYLYSKERYPFETKGYRRHKDMESVEQVAHEFNTTTSEVLGILKEEGLFN